ncbi:alanine dehydrogenase [Fulvivirga maritima]|uniref:alanine dehydrogenase n=1 Tax=Fulvivirga maritima TaxID=2904247 RepID=UPI001F1DB1B6|nr:alanine dehydrogenase [Fulvivirga maritima]UII27247.1 alanine dehydrogenase [Fulvivirga maritima]
MSKKEHMGFAELVKESSLSPEEKLMPVKKNMHSFFLGLPNEISLQERRITLTPDSVALLVNNGHEVWVETKAGLGSKFSDKDYSDAGAKIVYSAEEVYKAEAILKIEPPTLEEIEMMKPRQVLISAIQMGSQSAEYIKALNAKQITALAFEFIEDKVGGMPIIRAMSEIAGNTVMSIAAEYLSSSSGGKGVIMGGITGVPPTKVVILGAGTVAEYAARATIGLGADVEIFDNHIYKLRRIKQALGRQLYTSTIDSATLARSLKQADVVIGALRPEKGRNRYVVTEEMVAEMKPDSVIIDLSIDQGGCFETSEQTSLKNPVFRKYDVIHYCVPNIASRVAFTATTALSNIFTPTILRAAEEGGMEDMIFAHKWFMRGVYAYKGSLTNEHIARKFHMKHKDLGLLMAARF